MVKKIGLQIDKTLGPFTFYIDLQPDKDIKNKTPSSETIIGIIITNDILGPNF